MPVCPRLRRPLRRVNLVSVTHHAVRPAGLRTRYDLVAAGAAALLATISGCHSTSKVAGTAGAAAAVVRANGSCDGQALELTAGDRSTPLRRGMSLRVRVGDVIAVRTASGCPPSAGVIVQHPNGVLRQHRYLTVVALRPGQSALTVLALPCPESDCLGGVVPYVSVPVVVTPRWSLSVTPDTQTVRVWRRTADSGRIEATRVTVVCRG